MKWLSSHRPSSNIELVFPIRNELCRLPKLLAYYSQFDLVFIDDSSNDGSLEFLLKSSVSIVQRDRSKEPQSTAPTEAAVIMYLNQLSRSRLIIKLDADEYIDTLYFPVLLSCTQFSKLQLIKKRLDLHYGKQYSLYPSSQPLILSLNNFSADLLSIHSALTPIPNPSTLTIEIPVIHDGNLLSYNRLKKLIHYVNEERVESSLLGKSYISFIVGRYLRPLVLFPFRQFKYLFSSPHFYLFSFFSLFLEFLLAVFFLIEPKHVNE